LIKQKLLNKRRLRRNWHRFRTPESKRLLNTATRELKQLLTDTNNASFQTFLQDLSPAASTDYCLWKAAKKVKQAKNSSHLLRTTRGTWARTSTEKVLTLADHLTSVFQPHPSENPPEEEEALSLQLKILYQLKSPLSRFHRSEVQTVISNLKPKSSPGYDLITGKILQELPPTGIKYLTQIFNAAMLTGYFPAQWKVAKIILHLKPGKPPNEPLSYRPISLLPILSKVYEKLLLHRLLQIIEKRRLLPDHQFGFRQRHSIIHQTHRIVHKINETLETKQYYSAAFLDISKAFDRVWHTWLLHKLRQFLPLNCYPILKS
jgi:hypothetical protein